MSIVYKRLIKEFERDPSYTTISLELREKLMQDGRDFLARFKRIRKLWIWELEFGIEWEIQGSTGVNLHQLYKSMQRFQTLDLKQLNKRILILQFNDQL